MNEAYPDNRWTFKGWKLKTTDEKIIPYLKGQIVMDDVTFYAYYKEENVHSFVTMVEKVDDYFDFDNGTISIKNKFRSVLRGKITLPNVDPSGNEVTTVGDFNFNTANTYFTHIYFIENGCSYTTIADNAFGSGS
jgi:hypothetical protein